MERLRKAVARWLYPQVFAEVKSLRIHHAAHNKTMARDSKHIERLTKEVERLTSQYEDMKHQRDKLRENNKRLLREVREAEQGKKIKQSSK